ncbi:MAG: hypothetical protein LBJ24_02790 [Treponema sp.]|jgi:hypothetical protein|nr:hypothetical protein [Treponema sp.]
MFSFLSLSNRGGAKVRRSLPPLPFLLVLYLLGGAALFLAGCDTDGINTPYVPQLYIPPDSVQSVWVDSTGDWIIAVTGTTYTEYMPSMLDGSTDMDGDSLNTGKDTIMYSGTIAEPIDTSQEAGWIYIEIDDAYASGSSDEYYAVRWENYDGAGITFASSFLNGENSESSLNDIKNAAAGYDPGNDWSPLEPFTKVNVRVPLKGDLTDSAWGGTVEITDITYTDIYSYNMYTGVTYSGVIAGTTNPALSEGYIYIRYAATAGFPGGSIAGNYYTIHWKNNNSSTIDLSGSAHGPGKPALDEARREYTVANGYFSGYTTFTK